MPDPNTNLHDDTSGSTGGSSSGSTAVSATYYAKFKLKSNHQTITFYYYDNGVKKSKAISKDVDVVSHVSSKSVSNTVAKIPKGTSVSFVFGTKNGTTQPTPASILGTGTIVSVTYTTDISKEFTNTYYYSTGTQIYSFDKQDGKEIAVWGYKAPDTWSNYFTTNYLTDRIYNAGTTLANAPTHTIPGVGTTDPVAINLECYGNSSKTSSTYTAIVLLPGLEGSGKTGYHQTGWCYGSPTGTNYGYTKTVEIPNLSSKVVKLYANAVANTYYIKFNGNGNTGGSMSNLTMTYDTAKNLTANGFTKTGHHFVSWNTRADGSGTRYEAGASVKNLTSTNGGTFNLYAQWEANTYTLSFRNEDGSQHGHTSVTYGQSSTYKPTKVSHTGYTFNGWWYNGNKQYNADGTRILGVDIWDANGNCKYVGNNGDTVRLTPGFTPNSYTIKFNGNGNTGGSMSNLSMTYDTAKNLTSNGFTKTGYTFDKWTTNSDGTGTSYTNGQSVNNLTSVNNDTFNLYAQWKANTYYIKFNGNGATSGSMSNLTMTYNVTKNLTPNAFVRTGYRFDSWNTNSNGTGSKYTNGASVSNLTSTPNATFNLYAQWIEGLKVIFDCNGGSMPGDPSPEASDYKKFSRIMRNNTSDNNTINLPTRQDYVFDGWYTGAPSTTGGTPTGTKVYNWINATQCQANSVATSYWSGSGNAAVWVYSPSSAINEITLYAKWVKANCYVYWNNAWHPIKSIYTNVSNGWYGVGFKIYNNGWK